MEDLQSLLERINREGVEKAESEAAKILAAAREKAAKIVADARDEAARTAAEAKRAAEADAARAEKTMAQAARDTVLSVQSRLTAMLEQLLQKNVEAALAAPETAAKLAADALTALNGGAEITCGAKLAAALKAQLAAQGDLTVSADDSIKSGFTVKRDAGRVELSFTGATLADELARRLRPELAKLFSAQ